MGESSENCPMRTGIKKKLHAATAALVATIIAACGFAPSARANPPGSGWDLVFADEFNGSSLDTMKWNYNYTWGRTHNHAAYMKESQVIVTNGVLNLQPTAQRAPAAPAYVDTSDFGRQTLNYTSGAINSSGKFN